MCPLRRWFAQQEELVTRHAAHLGRDWVMFPNATYGSWRTAPVEAWERPLPLP